MFSPDDDYNLDSDLHETNLALQELQEEIECLQEDGEEVPAELIEKREELIDFINQYGV